MDDMRTREPAEFSVINCEISHNESYWDGGGICYDTGEVFDREGRETRNGAFDLIGCLIHNNTSEFGGGVYLGEGFWDYRESGNIINNTIANNYATDIGGGIYMEDTNLDLLNTILWRWRRTILYHYRY
jgi:predicted outer membrane repeat protein